MGWPPAAYLPQSISQSSDLREFSSASPSYTRRPSCPSQFRQRPGVP